MIGVNVTVNVAVPPGAKLAGKVPGLTLKRLLEPPLICRLSAGRASLLIFFNVIVLVRSGAVVELEKRRKLPWNKVMLSAELPS